MRRRATAFTIVELMVVVAIIVSLLGLILPAVTRARNASRLVQCASNMRQLSVAFGAYAAQFGSRYPPNLSAPSPGTHWYDDGVIAAYLPALRPPVPSGKPGGGVYVCPCDAPDPIFLSYAMNVWASCSVDPSVSALSPGSGQLWGPSSPHASQLILLVEAYSGTGNSSGWYAAPTVGAAYASSGPPSYTPASVTTAGERFGGAGGVLFTSARFGKPTSELCYYRHRTTDPSAPQALPVGCLNIAYADGHVAAKTNADLVLPNGQTTGDSYWSLADTQGH